MSIEENLKFPKPNPGVLNGKVVLISGASGGLGTAVTNAFLDAGAKVAGSARKIDGSDFSHSLFRAFPADVSKEADTASLVSQVVSEFGRIDILAHLVGAWAPGHADTTDLAALDGMLNVNLRTAFLTIRESLKQMKKQGGGGRILAVGSKLAVEPAAGSVAYGLAKAALVSLIRTVAAENRGSGITANIVLPSTIDTPSNREAMPTADFSKWVAPAQIAALMVHLASDQAAAVTGAVIPIFGGEA